jgi:hypothetical protein
LKAVREKKQITCKGKPIKITADVSTEILKARRVWGEIFWALNENNFNPRIKKTIIQKLSKQNYHSK